MVTKKRKENCKSNEDHMPLPMMPNLPEEIMVGEILWRLPVKSLVRFRSVCKSWNSIIASDPKFAILQFKNNSVKTHNYEDRIRVLLRDWDSSSVYLLDKKELTNIFTLKKLNCPLMEGCSQDDDTIVASSDGLVCIFEKTFVMVIWNPLTGETKRVLEPPIKLPHSYCTNQCRAHGDFRKKVATLSPGSCYRGRGGVQLPTCSCIPFSYGFGYDSSTNDYKLVRIWRGGYGKKFAKKEVRVYSLRTDSWRQIQDFPYIVYSGESGVFVNGDLYWTAYSENSSHLVSFDLAEEKFRRVDIDTIDVINPLNNCNRVAVLNEKLCLCFRMEWESHNLWLMNEYGSVEPWTKYSIPIPNARGLTPLFLLKNGKEVLLAAPSHDVDKFGPYNLEDQTFRSLQILGMPKKFQAMTFSETLISPKT